MKRLSIRFKITFWFTMALILVMLLTYFITFSVSNRIIQKTIRDSLIETVEHNVDEIEFYHSIEEMDLSGDVDHFLEYGNGYLEVDDDFLDAVNTSIPPCIVRTEPFCMGKIRLPAKRKRILLRIHRYSR